MYQYPLSKDDSYAVRPNTNFCMVMGFPKLSPISAHCIMLLTVLQVKFS